MILGKIASNERKINFNADIHCTNCGKQVPGGLKVGEKHSQNRDLPHIGRPLCSLGS